MAGNAGLGILHRSSTIDTCHGGPGTPMPFTAAMVGSHPGAELQQKDDDDRVMFRDGGVEAGLRLTGGHCMKPGPRSWPLGVFRGLKTVSPSLGPLFEDSSEVRKRQSSTWVRPRHTPRTRQNFLESCLELGGIDDI
jgi:hypothetical protein